MASLLKNSSTRADRSNINDMLEKGDSHKLLDAFDVGNDDRKRVFRYMSELSFKKVHEVATEIIQWFIFVNTKIERNSDNYR